MEATRRPFDAQLARIDASVAAQPHLLARVMECNERFAAIRSHNESR